MNVLMFISVLAIPVLVLLSDKFTYSRFIQLCRAPLALTLGISGLALGLLGGRAGELGVCLLVPYVQIVIFAVAAVLYRWITGRELEQKPFTAFHIEGKLALAFFDALVSAAVFAASFGMFVAYDALIQ